MLETNRFNLLRATRLPAVGLVAAIFLAVFLSGCAITPQSEEDYVLERAQSRWDAIIAGDIETAYQYYSPGYRSTHSMIDLGVSQRVRRVKQTSAEYLTHSCEESRCTVLFSVGFRVVEPVPGMSVYTSSSSIEDTWIKTNGEWWYLPKK